MKYFDKIYLRSSEANVVAGNGAATISEAAGVGTTRMSSEIAEAAGANGAMVLRGSGT
jgi:hypothetical protein